MKEGEAMATTEMALSEEQVTAAAKMLLVLRELPRDERMSAFVAVCKIAIEEHWMWPEQADRLTAKISEHQRRVPGHAVIRRAR